MENKSNLNTPVLMVVFVIVVMMLLGRCANAITAGGDGYEETNRALIHQAGVNAGVDAIMGTR